MARLTVFGLNMADTTYADIMAAIRGLYPADTAGLSDALAAQTVLKTWAVDLLARWHAQEAADPSAAAQAALQSALDAQDQASTAARTSGNADIQTTSP